MCGEGRSHNGEGFPKADVTAVRRFIRMTLYYRTYNYDEEVPPLHALTNKGVKVSDSWNEGQWMYLRKIYVRIHVS